MFYWVDKQTVRSDAGVTIQRIDRFHLKYIDGQQALVFAIESGWDAKKNRPANYIVVPPADQITGPIPVSAPEREKMVKNLEEALEFKGLTPYVVEK